MAEPRTRKRAADRKAEIVDVAMSLAAVTGPDRVTTQHLADHIGVTQPAIFRHFPSKHDIWLAVGDRIGEQLAQVETRAGKTDNTLVGYVHGFADLYGRIPALSSILNSRELRHENPGVLERLDSLVHGRLDFLTEHVSQLQDRGELRRDIAPRDAAALLASTLDGLAMHLSHPSQGPVFDMEIEELFAPLLSAFAPD